MAEYHPTITLYAVKVGNLRVSIHTDEAIAQAEADRTPNGRVEPVESDPVEVVE